MKLKDKVIVVTGSLAFDQILNLPGVFSSYILPEKIHEINVSFVTETHRKALGGTGGNQAYSLSLFGVRPVLFATAGSDFSAYRIFLEKAGIETSHIFIVQNQLTAAGFAITDMKDNQIWGFSKGAMTYAKNYSLVPLIKKYRSNLFVMIAPNEPKAITRYINECVEHAVPFAFDPAFYIPTLSRSSLQKGVAYARIVFGNDYEIALLEKRLPQAKQGLPRDSIWVTTFGEKGSAVYMHGTSVRVKSAKPKKVVDPTGAGDAYRAGFLAGYLQGKSPRVCAQLGSVSASFAIEEYGTMNHSFTKNEFLDRYEKNYGVPVAFVFQNDQKYGP